MSGTAMLDSRLRGRREDLLAEVSEIEGALHRIEEGAYGLCTRCGAAIDAERLALQPATSWCRACKHDYALRRGIRCADNGAA